MTVNLKRLKPGEAEKEGKRLREVEEPFLEDARKSVLEIIEAVRKGGDKALIDLTQRFDGVKLDGPILLDKDVLEDAWKKTDSKIKDSIRRSTERVSKYHERERENSWMEAASFGIYGLLKVPLERVGVYVPGGKATYPSTVVMTCVPAKVAGVKEIYGFTPPSKSGMPPNETLAAFYVCGADGVYRVGGAQAIAAAALGTESVKKMDKVVGPGNIYVSLAKRELFGIIGIDSIAGPSEVLIIADDGQDPYLLALDLLSQLEHDTTAKAVLISTSESLGEAVIKEVERKAKKAKRSSILESSLKNLMVYTVHSMEDALELSNSYCPEHLQLMVENPFELIGHIKCAGSVFLGSTTPVPFGDYCAGPNHVLPTGGSARFSSALGVHDFYRRIGVLHLNQSGIFELAEDVITLSGIEGLELHGESVAARRKK